MKIVIKNPPNIEEIKKHFDIEGKIIYYTYGDTIYNPSDDHITEDFIVHEEVHMLQQQKYGGPEKWWRRYFEDPLFRVDQEAQAYGHQYRYLLRVNAKYARQELERFARVLSGPTYGSPVEYLEARKAILNKSISS